MGTHRSLLLGASLLLLAITACSGMRHKESKTAIEFANGKAIDTLELPCLSKQNRKRSIADDKPDQFLIHCDYPVRTGIEHDIANAIGAKVQGFMPKSTFIVHAPYSDVIRAKNIPGVAWIGEVSADHKIASGVLGGNRREYAVSTVLGGVNQKFVEDLKNVLKNEHEVELPSVTLQTSKDFLITLPKELKRVDEVILTIAKQSEVHWISHQPKYYKPMYSALI
eukprot:Colp12_sorted_trinity150504_noHs@15817